MSSFKDNAFLYVPSMTSTMSFDQFKLLIKDKNQKKIFEFEKELYIKNNITNQQIYIRTQGHKIYLTCCLESKYLHELCNDHLKLVYQLDKNNIEIEINEYISKHLLNDMFHHLM